MCEMSLADCSNIPYSGYTDGQNTVGFKPTLDGEQSMKKILTATLAVAIALAPASAITQGVITGQQTYVTGSKPDAKPGKYKVVKIKKAKAVHHKHSYKVAKAPPGKYKVAKVKRTKAVHHKHSYKVAKAPPGKYKVAKQGKDDKGSPPQAFL